MKAALFASAILAVMLIGCSDAARGKAEGEAAKAAQAKAEAELAKAKLEAAKANAQPHVRSIAGLFYAGDRAIGTYELTEQGDDSYGYCNGAVVFEKGLPRACFGLNKQPKENTRYRYFILFKSGPQKPKGGGTAVRLKSGVDWDSGIRTVDDSASIHLYQTIELAYRLETDAKTHALKKEVIKVGDTELKEGDPRVFLVDFTQEKITYRPEKVDLPDEAPELKDLDTNAWSEKALRTVEQLRKNSPVVKEFLEK